VAKATSQEKKEMWVEFALSAMANYNVEVSTKYADSMLDEYEARFESGGGSGRRKRKRDEDDDEDDE
jgi:hypothetical protein